MTITLERPATQRFDVVDAATRREFLAALSAVALLSACSGDDTAPTTEAETTTWSGGPFGLVEVPRDPQRVVACNGVDADFALVLDLPLVGASGAIGFAQAPFADYHADRLAGVNRVVAGGEPDLEQVAAVRPDLILDSWDTEPDRYDDWSALAPTVNFAPALYPDDFARTDWKGALAALGSIFGRESQATRAVEDYDQAVADAKERLDLPAGTTFAAINLFEGINVIDQSQLISLVAVDLGLTPSSLVATDPASRVQLSLEETGRLEAADVLLIAVPPSGESLDRDLSEIQPLLDSPLWQLVPAVQAGRVVQYPSELYYASPLTAPMLATAVADGLA